MSKTSANLIDLVTKYIVQSQYNNLPQNAINSAKTFILDSVGVGISGSRVPMVEQVKEALKLSGDFETHNAKAKVWVTGESVSTATAALINGYQIHNQEWDCVHEGAVVHPMATILSALIAYAQQNDFTGEQLILGVVVAVDIATLIGDSVNNPLQFFRPSICGCLGATAGMCAMNQSSKNEIENALGIAYSQLSGTMQAHIEGSPMLAMQIGINSRAAITAMNLAKSGFKGPKDILQGPFGYFNLFETDYDPEVIPSKLGIEYQITRVSHKPFPTGRAGHGTVDGLQVLMKEHNFDYTQIKHITVAATPLINRLVGRPAKADMNASYAKLCNGYIAATALLTGTVSVQDFDDDKLVDPKRLALADIVTTELNDCEDPNALAPMTVSVELNNGRKLHQHFPAVLGHPERPFTRSQQEIKFDLACKSAIEPFTSIQIAKLMTFIDELETCTNINELVELMVNHNEQKNKLIT